MTFYEIAIEYKEEVISFAGVVGSFVFGWYTKGRREAKISDLDIRQKEQDYTKDYVEFTDELVERVEDLQNKIIILQSTITEVRRENINLNLEIDLLKDMIKGFRKENSELKLRLDEHKNTKQ